MNEKNLTAAVAGEVKKAIVGKDSVAAKVLMALLARGTSCWRTARGWARPPWPWPSPRR